MRYSKIVLILMLVILSLSSYQRARAEDLFRWTNPIDVRIRDPQIIVVGSNYYMTGTAPPFFEQLGQSPGVKLWTSHDLLHWTDLGVIVAPSKHHWFKQRFWAPEIFRNPADGKFYCTFACPNGPAKTGTQSIGMAVANSICGPYRVVTVEHPLCTGNDADLFRDSDGKTYVFLAGVNAMQVDLPDVKVIGKPFHIIGLGPEGAWDGRSKGAPAVGIEGPSCVKIGPTYYLFYSSWGRGYEVGYATATSITGPWKKYVDNPIYGAQDKTWAKRYKHKYTQAPSIPWRQVGHNSLFIGPNGKWWICAHGYRKHDNTLHPHLVIDLLYFVDGVFEKTPVSYKPKAVKVDPAVYPPHG